MGNLGPSDFGGAFKDGKGSKNFDFSGLAGVEIPSKQIPWASFMTLSKLTL